MMTVYSGQISDLPERSLVAPRLAFGNQEIWEGEKGQKDSLPIGAEGHTICAQVRKRFRDLYGFCFFFLLKKTRKYGNIYQTNIVKSIYFSSEKSTPENRVILTCFQISLRNARFRRSPGIIFLCATLGWVDRPWRGRYKRISLSGLH